MVERLAFREGVEVATGNMTSGNSVLKSMYSPLRMCCCSATGTGGRDCDSSGSRGLVGMDEAVDNASSLGT